MIYGLLFLLIDMDRYFKKQYAYLLLHEKDGLWLSAKIKIYIAQHSERSHYNVLTQHLITIIFITQLSACKDAV